MVLIHELWLPILVSTVLVFAASNLVWMVLPHHKSDTRALPDESTVLDALGKQGLRPGLYRFPWARSMAEMKDPAFVAKLDKSNTFFFFFFSCSRHQSSCSAFHPAADPKGVGQSRLSGGSSTATPTSLTATRPGLQTGEGAPTLGQNGTPSVASSRPGTGRSLSITTSIPGSQGRPDRGSTGAPAYNSSKPSADTPAVCASSHPAAKPGSSAQRGDPIKVLSVAGRHVFEGPRFCLPGPTD